MPPATTGPASASDASSGPQNGLPASPRARWVAALRSGDYKQTSGALRKKKRGENSYSYCCLGVACDVLEQPVDNSVRGWSAGICGLLPFRVEELLQLGPATQDDLAYMNDERGMSFAKIADYIESLGERPMA